MKTRKFYRVGYTHLGYIAYDWYGDFVPMLKKGEWLEISWRAHKMYYRVSKTVKDLTGCKF